MNECEIDYTVNGQVVKDFKVNGVSIPANSVVTLVEVDSIVMCQATFHPTAMSINGKKFLPVVD